MVAAVIWLLAINFLLLKTDELGQSSQNGQAQTKKGEPSGSPQELSSAF
jgi:hypothetical protein